MSACCPKHTASALRQAHFHREPRVRASGIPSCDRAKPGKLLTYTPSTENLQQQRQGELRIYFVIRHSCTRCPIHAGIFSALPAWKLWNRTQTSFSAFTSTSSESS